MYGVVVVAVLTDKCLPTRVLPLSRARAVCAKRCIAVLCCATPYVIVDCSVTLRLRSLSN